MADRSSGFTDRPNNLLDFFNQYIRTTDDKPVKQSNKDGDPTRAQKNSNPSAVTKPSNNDGQRSAKLFNRNASDAQRPSTNRGSSKGRHCYTEAETSEPSRRSTSVDFDRSMIRGGDQRSAVSSLSQSRVSGVGIDHIGSVRDAMRLAAIRLASRETVDENTSSSGLDKKYLVPTVGNEFSDMEEEEAMLKSAGEFRIDPRHTVDRESENFLAKEEAEVSDGSSVIKASGFSRSDENFHMTTVSRSDQDCNNITAGFFRQLSRFSRTTSEEELREEDRDKDDWPPRRPIIEDHLGQHSDMDDAAEEGVASAKNWFERPGESHDIGFPDVDFMCAHSQAGWPSRRRTDLPPRASLNVSNNSCFVAERPLVGETPTGYLPHSSVNGRVVEKFSPSARNTHDSRRKFNNIKRCQAALLDARDSRAGDPSVRVGSIEGCGGDIRRIQKISGDVTTVSLVTAPGSAQLGRQHDYDSSLPGWSERDSSWVPRVSEVPGALQGVPGAPQGMPGALQGVPYDVAQIADLAVLQGRRAELEACLTQRVQQLQQLQQHHDLLKDLLDQQRQAELEGREGAEGGEEVLLSIEGKIQGWDEAILGGKGALSEQPEESGDSEGEMDEVQMGCRKGQLGSHGKFRSERRPKQFVEGLSLPREGHEQQEEHGRQQGPREVNVRQLSGHRMQEGQLVVRQLEEQQQLQQQLQQQQQQQIHRSQQRTQTQLTQEMLPTMLQLQEQLQQQHQQLINLRPPDDLLTLQQSAELQALQQQLLQQQREQQHLLQQVEQRTQQQHNAKQERELLKLLLAEEQEQQRLLLLKKAKQQQTQQQIQTQQQQHLEKQLHQSTQQHQTQQHYQNMQQHQQTQQLMPPAAYKKEKTNARHYCSEEFLPKSGSAGSVPRGSSSVLRGSSSVPRGSSSVPDLKHQKTHVSAEGTNAERARYHDNEEPSINEEQARFTRKTSEERTQNAVMPRRAPAKSALSIEAEEEKMQEAGLQQGFKEDVAAWDLGSNAWAWVDFLAPANDGLLAAQWNAPFEGQALSAWQQLVSGGPGNPAALAVEEGGGRIKSAGRRSNGGDRERVRSMPTEGRAAGDVEQYLSGFLQSETRLANVLPPESMGEKDQEQEDQEESLKRDLARLMYARNELNNLQEVLRLRGRSENNSTPGVRRISNTAPSTGNDSMTPVAVGDYCQLPEESLSRESPRRKRFERKNEDKERWERELSDEELDQELEQEVDDSDEKEEDEQERLELRQESHRDQSEENKNDSAGEQQEKDEDETLDDCEEDSEQDLDHDEAARVRSEGESGEEREGNMEEKLERGNEDPEVAARMDRLREAKEKLRRLEELVAMVQRLPTALASAVQRGVPFPGISEQSGSAVDAGMMAIAEAGIDSLDRNERRWVAERGRRMEPSGREVRGGVPERSADSLGARPQLHNTQQDRSDAYILSGGSPERCEEDVREIADEWRRSREARDRANGAYGRATEVWSRDQEQEDPSRSRNLRRVEDPSLLGARRKEPRMGMNDGHRRDHELSPGMNRPDGKDDRQSNLQQDNTWRGRFGMNAEAQHSVESGAFFCDECGYSPVTRTEEGARQQVNVEVHHDLNDNNNTDSRVNRKKKLDDKTAGKIANNSVAGAASRGESLSIDAEPVRGLTPTHADMMNNVVRYRNQTSADSDRSKESNREPNHRNQPKKENRNEKLMNANVARGCRFGDDVARALGGGGGREYLGEIANGRLRATGEGRDTIPNNMRELPKMAANDGRRQTAVDRNSGGRTILDSEGGNLPGAGLFREEHFIGVGTNSISISPGRSNSRDTGADDLSRGRRGGNRNDNEPPTYRLRRSNETGVKSNEASSRKKVASNPKRNSTDDASSLEGAMHEVRSLRCEMRALERALLSRPSAPAPRCEAEPPPADIGGPPPELLSWLNSEFGRLLEEGEDLAERFDRVEQMATNVPIAVSIEAYYVRGGLPVAGDYTAGSVAAPLSIEDSRPVAAGRSTGRESSGGGGGVVEPIEMRRGVALNSIPKRSTNASRPILSLPAAVSHDSETRSSKLQLVVSNAAGISASGKNPTSPRLFALASSPSPALILHNDLSSPTLGRPRNNADESILWDLDEFGEEEFPSTVLEADCDPRDLCPPGDWNEVNRYSSGYEVRLSDFRAGFSDGSRPVRRVVGRHGHENSEGPRNSFQQWRGSGAGSGENVCQAERRGNAKDLESAGKICCQVPPLKLPKSYNMHRSAKTEPTCNDVEFSQNLRPGLSTGISGAGFPSPVDRFDESGSRTDQSEATASVAQLSDAAESNSYHSDLSEHNLGESEAAGGSGSSESSEGGGGGGDGELPFEALQDTIYSEVATLISQNEDHPHYLIGLFRDLQRLVTEGQCDSALRAVDDIVADYLTEDGVGDGSRALREESMEAIRRLEHGLILSNCDSPLEYSPRVPSPPEYSPRIPSPVSHSDLRCDQLSGRMQGAIPDRLRETGSGWIEEASGSPTTYSTDPDHEDIEGEEACSALPVAPVRPGSSSSLRAEQLGFVTVEFTHPHRLTPPGVATSPATGPVSRPTSQGGSSAGSSWDRTRSIGMATTSSDGSWDKMDADALAEEGGGETGERAGGPEGYSNCGAGNKAEVARGADGTDDVECRASFVDEVEVKQGQGVKGEEEGVFGRGGERTSDGEMIEEVLEFDDTNCVGGAEASEGSEGCELSVDDLPFVRVHRASECFMGEGELWAGAPPRPLWRPETDHSETVRLCRRRLTTIPIEELERRMEGECQGWAGAEGTAGLDRGAGGGGVKGGMELLEALMAEEPELVGDSLAIPPPDSTQDPTNTRVP